MKQTGCTLSVVVLALLAQLSIADDEYHRRPRNFHRHAASAPINEKEATFEFWMGEAQAAIAAHARSSRERGSARNVVMFLGDGMSVPTLAAARTLLGQRNRRTGEETRLSFEEFPSVGLSKTYCVDSQIPDSACTATAYLCGAKANLGTIGVLAGVPRYACEASLDPAQHVQSIAAWALQDGRDAGIVTTARVTHASPAGAYAHVADRDWESDADVRAAGADPARCRDIAHQLVHGYPGNQFKVILGGGRREFLPNGVVDEEGARGRREDGRHLIEEWQMDKIARNVTYQYVWNRDQLLSGDAELPEYLLGLFEASHLQYNMEADARTEPSLAELTEVAIRSLSRNERGFFLFVEGGRIDHAHHDNLAELALDETIELSRAVARATRLLAEEDSLLVVTADHAHVMAFNGYSARGADVLGASGDRDADGVPYMTLSYTNGPGHRREVDGRQQDVTQDADYRSAQWRSPAGVPLAQETHGGDDVAVFARGAHAAAFGGVLEQSRLPHLMAYAACLGPGARACDADTTRLDSQ
ncbi:membrane-bound alkaline phosphatase-like [Maniola jurtina]|uniref:membrane-bound alkaline phosphatase-like n=1 Tax=Maniola jurtina TaxID=191418 RepID=UPI001E68CE5D|nr:membrane-bound alkaline phosphatase-like [Maniola jurtina]